MTRTSTKAVVAGLLAASLTVAVVELPAFGAGTTHTRTLTAKPSGPSVDQGKHLILADADFNNGNLVGRDVLNCTFTSVATCDATIALKPGSFFAHVTLDQVGNLSGDVTGGTGAYKHANGTITGHGNSKNHNEVITLKYKN